MISDLSFAVYSIWRDKLGVQEERPISNCSSRVFGLLTCCFSSKAIKNRSDDFRSELRGVLDLAGQAWCSRGEAYFELQFSCVWSLDLLLFKQGHQEQER